MTIILFGREITLKKAVLIPAAVIAVVAAGLVGFRIAGSGKDIIIESGNGEKVASISAAKQGIQNGKGVGKASMEKEKNGQSNLTADDQEETEGLEGLFENAADTDNKDSKDDKDKKVQADSIKVYIVGCVKKPVVVAMKKGQLIDDAVKLAGGLTEAADPNSINMVYELKENVMLYIQSAKEAGKDAEQQNSATDVKAPDSGSGAGKGVKIIKDSGGAQVTGSIPVENTTQGSGNGKININTATESELDTLPGIGQATAREIIAYREAHGPFKKLTDIMNIPRIKEGRYNAIKDFITLGQ